MAFSTPQHHNDNSLEYAFLFGLLGFTVSLLIMSAVRGEDAAAHNANITAHIQMCDCLGLAHSVHFKDDDATKEVIYVNCEPN